MTASTVTEPEPDGGPGALQLTGHRGDDPAQRILANLVLQGGGSLGIAHLGAIAALEDKGYRFVGLAGASAGAIAVTLMAACREQVEDRCAERLRRILLELPASDFVDGPASVRKVIKRLIPPRPPKLDDLRLIPACVQAVRTLSKRMGLNSGNAFARWLDETLREQFGVTSMGDLEAKVTGLAKTALPRIGDGTYNGPLEWGHFLALTTTALPTGLRITLPRHLRFFDPGLQQSSPADMVRASMSVPGFFEPVGWKLSNGALALWEHEDFARLLDPGESETLRNLDRLTLVDGGLLSNFPVDAFSEDFIGIPGHPCSQLPTIGILLTRQPRPSRRSNGLRALIRGAAQMLNAARAARDREARVRLFRRRNWEPGAHDLDHRLIHVDTGDHNWLDFSLATEALDDLYARGREAVEREFASRPQPTQAPKEALHA